MGFDTREWKEFEEHLKKEQEIWDKFVTDCAKELAARLLSAVIHRTPVDTGALRRGWIAQTGGSGAEGLKTRGAKQYVESLPVHHFGDVYVIEIRNPLEYASYVEFGHRTRDGQGWVEGRFFLTLSESEIQAKAPQILESRIKRKLGEYFR